MADVPELPKKTAADVAYGVVKAAVAAAPLVGGSAAEIIGIVFGPPLERRRDKWSQQLADAVNEIIKTVSELTPEKLSQSDVFVTTALHASQIAIRTHQDEKLQALKNAVIHASLPGAPTDSIQQIFLNYVDRFTPWHLAILSLFDGPEGWLKAKSIPMPTKSFGSRAALLEEFLPDLRGARGLYDQIVRDLHAAGLLATDGLHTMITGAGAWQKITTPLGSGFLAFISSVSR